MPHIEIEMYPGRTDEQKIKCADAVAEAVAASLGCNVSSVSVSIKEVEKENWKKDVWDKKIVNNPKLYKLPGYTCE